MGYNFKEKYSSYLIEKYIAEALDISNESTINIVKNIMFKDAEFVELCNKIDVDFNNLLALKLKNNNIEYLEGETVDKKNNVHTYSQFTFNENEKNGFTIRVQREDMAKIKFVNEYLKKIAKFLTLQKDSHVKRYIKLLKEQEKINNTKNIVIKHFALKKIRKDIIILSTNISVCDYIDLLKQKDMLNSIFAVKNDLSDEKLFNNTYYNIENEINSKICENEFNGEVIKQLNNEKEVYNSFYNNLNAIQHKITELTKVEIKEESTLKVLDEGEIELTK